MCMCINMHAFLEVCLRHYLLEQVSCFVTIPSSKGNIKKINTENCLLFLNKLHHMSNLMKYDS